MTQEKKPDILSLKDYDATLLEFRHLKRFLLQVRTIKRIQQNSAFNDGYKD